MPKGPLHLKDKNVQLMLEITTVASGNGQSSVAVCRFGVGVFLLPLSLVLVIKKSEDKRFQVGMAAWASSQNSSWAEASVKIQIIFKKRKAFYNFPSAQIEIPLTTYKSVGILAQVQKEN